MEESSKGEVSSGNSDSFAQISYDLPESRESGKVIPHEIFHLFIQIAKVEASLSEKQKFAQKSGIFFFTDKILLKISLFANFIKFPEDKLRSFFFSNIFNWSSIPQLDMTRLFAFHYLTGAQSEWLLFDYPLHELIDEPIQILYTSKAPTYELIQDKKVDSAFQRKRVYSTIYYDSISIEPSEKMQSMTSGATLEQILAQNSAPNPRKDNKCWLLTQD